MGRRQSNTSGGTATAYLYGGSDIVQEQQGGSPSANLLTGAGTDERFTRATTGSGAATATYLTDALGSSVGLASTSATVQRNYGYDPYGATSVSGTANTSAYQFTGRENDGTGLYFYRARYYTPPWGRFISQDPIGLAGGINLYQYAGNNPVSFRDSNGLQMAIPYVPVGPPGGSDSGSIDSAAQQLANWLSPSSDPFANLPARLVPSTTTPPTGPTRSDPCQDSSSNVVCGTGSYTNTHQSGKTYSGKGDKARAAKSGKRIADIYQDPLVSTDWTPAPTDRQSFIDENRRIIENGGEGNVNLNYNQINSPGAKY